MGTGPAKAHYDWETARDMFPNLKLDCYGASPVTMGPTASLCVIPACSALYTLTDAKLPRSGHPHRLKSIY
jgi:hypothetical protein